MAHAGVDVDLEIEVEFEVEPDEFELALGDRREVEGRLDADGLTIAVEAEIDVEGERR